MSVAQAASLKLGPDLDVAAGRACLATAGRASLQGFLDEAFGQRLLRDCETPGLWSLSFNDKGRELDLDAAQSRAMKPHLQLELAKRINSYPQEGFQYCFDTCRVSDRVEAGNSLPATFVALYRGLNSAAMLAWFRDLTGDPTINYLDLQATRYRRGHFLTSHDDDSDGKHRRYAFVLNLTPVWRADWGGVLVFLDQAGDISAGLTPGWNRLNIFKVPQRHAVTMVTPAAIGARYSFTGWLRALPDGPPAHLKHA